MKDTYLCSQILGLSEPWVVDAVQLNTAEGRVDIYVGQGFGVRWACPPCGWDWLVGIMPSLGTGNENN